jgi:hypothetical protein
VRLVYADWLEEKGDARAAFLRAQVGSGPLPQLELDPDWVAQVDRTPIENCPGVQFAYACPKKWEDLAPRSERVRFCGACQQEVHHCTSVAEAQSHAWQGHCVAVGSFVPRAPGDLQPVEPLMGIIVPPPEPPPEPEPPKKRWWQFWR